MARIICLRSKPMRRRILGHIHMPHRLTFRVSVGGAGEVVEEDGEWVAGLDEDSGKLRIIL